jgi:predicted nucleotidyltransferase
VISDILKIVADWAESQNDIRGLALVGSHARGNARAGSDIDLVFLCRDANRFRDPESLNGIDWSRAGMEVIKWADEDYSALWSRRAWVTGAGEIEFGFTSLSWADISPVERGTAEVMSGGCRILYDPDRLLTRLAEAVAPFLKDPQ